MFLPKISKRILIILVIAMSWTMLISIPDARADGPQLAPDGTWVGGTPKMAPDGTWVGGKPEMAPDGKWVGGDPEIAPDGSFVGGTPNSPPMVHGSVANLN